MRKQIELLEHHADIIAQHSARRGTVVQCDTVDRDRAPVMRLKPVDAADQRGFAGTGRSANDDLLAKADIEADIV